MVMMLFDDNLHTAKNLQYTVYEDDVTPWAKGGTVLKCRKAF